MITALAVLADIAGMTCLFLANLPPALKLGVGIAAVLIPIAALFFYLGERRSWIRYVRHKRDLER